MRVKMADDRSKIGGSARILLQLNMRAMCCVHIPAAYRSTIIPSIICDSTRAKDLGPECGMFPSDVCTQSSKRKEDYIRHFTISMSLVHSGNDDVKCFVLATTCIF